MLIVMPVASCMLETETRPEWMTQPAGIYYHIFVRIRECCIRRRLIKRSGAGTQTFCLGIGQALRPRTN